MTTGSAPVLSKTVPPDEKMSPVPQLNVFVEKLELRMSELDTF